MKRFCLFLVSVVMIAAVEAKEKKEPVVMRVVDKDVPLSEFIFMAKKDNSVDFKNKQSVKNYVELFRNFKLKVADAEALSIHETPKFEAELERYSQQLQQSYLSDKASEDSAMLEIYDRLKIIPGIKQIFFKYPKELDERELDITQQKRILTKDTLALFEKTNAAYTRILNGESFEEVGESFANDSSVYYSVVGNVFPFQFQKAVEERIFSMKPGEFSSPVRTRIGFYLVKLDSIKPNPGNISVAHILSRFPSENPTADEIEATRWRSEEIYQKAINNEDFKALVQTFSDDTMGVKRGGILEFSIGDIIEPIEKAGFALKNIGDISKPFQSRYGFHILQLVARKTEIPPFEEIAGSISDAMQNSERYFDLYRGSNERMKTRHGYVFYPEAYEELQRLADEYFPLDSAFVSRGMQMKKTLVYVDSLDFTQDLFVEYIFRKNRTPNAYSVDFMQDVFDFFVRDILTGIATNSLETDYPDYRLQMQEYYDGILLFELSNKRVWSRAPEEQEKLEAEWIKELNEKYPVKINWKVINRIKKI